MKNQGIFDRVLSFLRSVIQNFPDKRKSSPNLRYSMEDLALAAFSVFFTQSPSFLAYQKTMEQAKGKSNAQTLFGMDEIPTDNQIRDILDEVPPQQVFPVFDKILEEFKQAGLLDSFRGFDGQTLIPLDGTWYFSSQNISCENCSTLSHKNGDTTFYHSAITPVIVGQEQKYAIPLRPEFILPQDGHDKQDCETAAAKRWIAQHASYYRGLLGEITILGDDLFSKQPLCQEVLVVKGHFIFVCKPESHKTLYEWIEQLEKENDLNTLSTKRWNGRFWEIYTYNMAFAHFFVKNEICNLLILLKAYFMPNYQKIELFCF